MERPTNGYYVNHTLIVVKSPTQILLGYKKRGSGAGKWNCFGGKVNKDEEITRAAVRELKEESGLISEEKDLRHVAILDFAWIEKSEMHLDHVFVCENFKGDIVETEEMRPQWFDVKKIPYQQMWQSDRIWLPLVLENKTFRGYFTYNYQGEILEAKVRDGLNDENSVLK